MAIDIKRAVTLGELISAGVAVLGFILSFWMTTNVRLSALELNQQNAEKRYEKLDVSIQKTNEKLDRISEKLNILIGKGGD